MWRWPDTDSRRGRFQCQKAIGYEIRDDVYKKALEEVAKANLSKPNVITLYLNSATNEKLKQKFEKEVSTETRIVSHNFSLRTCALKHDRQKPRQ